MGPPEPHNQVEARVRKVLDSTPYAPADLTPLSGGTVNFIYRASLRKPLPDGICEVLVKHGEDYLKVNSGVKLSTSRCCVEQDCLEILSELKIVGKADADDAYRYAVRTPQTLYFDAASNTQVQEYLPSGIDLKTYVLANLPANTPESRRAECVALGKAIGRWLRELHDRSSAPESGPASKAGHQSKLKRLVGKNVELQKLKHIINFEWLQGKPDMFPNVLGEDARQAFAKVRDLAAQELEDESRLEVIHGDFWPGNVLLPNRPVSPGKEIPVFVVDWEMAQLGVRSLDLGQMAAELYELWLYKSITAGLWIIEGFAAGYGVVTEDSAFRTVIQAGAHLVGFGTSTPDWGTPAQNEMVAERGRDLIMHAYNRDRRWLDESELACLFSNVQ